MQTVDARHCAQAVANLQEAAAQYEGVVSLEKAYEAKAKADKAEKKRVALLAAVFLRSQQIISRDLDIVTRRNDRIYYEPVRCVPSIKILVMSCHLTVVMISIL